MVKIQFLFMLWQLIQELLPKRVGMSHCDTQPQLCPPPNAASFHRALECLPPGSCHPFNTSFRNSPGSFVVHNKIKKHLITSMRWRQRILHCTRLGILETIPTTKQCHVTMWQLVCGGKQVLQVDYT